MITAGIREAFRWAYGDDVGHEPVPEPEVDAVLHGEMLHCQPLPFVGHKHCWPVREVVVTEDEKREIQLKYGIARELRPRELPIVMRELEVRRRIRKLKREIREIERACESIDDTLPSWEDFVASLYREN